MMVYLLLGSLYLVERMRATMRPYRPRTSAKIRIRIMPTKSRGCWAGTGFPSNVLSGSNAALPCNASDRRDLMSVLESLIFSKSSAATLFFCSEDTDDV